MVFKKRVTFFFVFMKHNKNGNSTGYSPSIKRCATKVSSFPFPNCCFTYFFINAATVVSFYVAAVTKLTTWISICRLPATVVKLKIRNTNLILNKLTLCIPTLKLQSLFFVFLCSFLDILFTNYLVLLVLTFLFCRQFRSRVSRQQQ